MGAVRWMGIAVVVSGFGHAATGWAQEVLASLPRANEHVEREGQAVIEIWKADRKLELREGELVLRRIQVALGQQPRSGKEVRGDGRTPVGRYAISDKKAESRYRRFLGINYPNLDDAERGYRRGMISAGQWADLFFANLRGEIPRPDTLLGGRVGIHGYGRRPYLPVDWTEGCIAVSNDDIDYIFSRVSVGTPVIINE